MTIKNRLLLGFSTLPFLFLILVGVGWYQIAGIRATSVQLQQNHDRVNLASSLLQGVKDEAISLRNLFLITDKTAVEQELITLQTKGQEVDRNLQLLESSARGEQQKKISEDLKSTNQTYKLYRDKVVQLYSQGQRETAISLVNANSAKLQEQYFNSVDALFDASDDTLTVALTGLSNDFSRQLLWGTFLSLIGVVIGIGVVSRSIWTIASRLKAVSGTMIEVANGSAALSTKIAVASNDEIDDVARSFNTMTESLAKQTDTEKQHRQKSEELAWIKSNLADIATSLSGIQDLQTLSQTLLSKTVPLVEASQAILYIADTNEHDAEPVYKLLAAYAHKERSHLATRIKLGEGLVGQAAFEKTPIILANVPPDYIRIHSGLGEAIPQHVYVLPICYEGTVIAIIELASLHAFNSTQQLLMDELVENVGIILDNIMRRMRLAELLRQSQALMEELQVQSEELQSQQEELRAANEELEEQTSALRQSEEKLQVQQEELEQTNAELREKAEMLEVQNQALEVTNTEIEQARKELEEKARQLALSSRYKSEFLANMSHELRTPLNSLLILSKLLSDNQHGNLSEKQVQFAETIYSSGCDLLSLINEILDLSKIESGKMGINPSHISIKSLAVYVEKQFRAVAQEKKIGFHIIVKDELPATFYSDEQRIQQILKNLLSNAFKFTHRGEVTLSLGLLESSGNPGMPKLCFSVTDTGIGIPSDKQDIIFQAFHQADGTTSRKYGGTGLGLTIAREMALMLGGEIAVHSVEGQGSTFSLLIADYEGQNSHVEQYLKLDEAAAALEPPLLKAKGPVPAEHAVRRRANETAKAASASKEPYNSIKRLLIVDDDWNQRNSLMELIGDKNVIITAVCSAAEAREQLKVNQFDCMVLDLGLPDATGFELLDQIKAHPDAEHMAIFIYTGRDLTSKEEMQLKRYAHTIIIKDAHSPTRLLEELELFLNRSNQEAETADDWKEGEAMPDITGLDGLQVLLVDDDVRNVFAISNVLEMYGMHVALAENGVEAVKLLEERSDFDLILMDIMMPEMDGYEAMRIIRTRPQYLDLPIIALTAKAMKEDREKCLEAGASDYIVKPVIPEQLISLVRVWVCPDEQ